MNTKPIDFSRIDVFYTRLKSCSEIQSADKLSLENKEAILNAIGQNKNTTYLIFPNRSLSFGPMELVGCIILDGNSQKGFTEQLKNQLDNVKEETN